MLVASSCLFIFCVVVIQRCKCLLLLSLHGLSNDLWFRDFLILMNLMIWERTRQVLELKNRYANQYWCCSLFLFPRLLSFTSSFIGLQHILISFFLLFSLFFCSLCSYSADFFTMAVLLKERSLSIWRYGTHHFILKRLYLVELTLHCFSCLYIFLFYNSLFRL